MRSAVSQARTMRSPTPTPRLPPRNRKSITAAITGWFMMEAVTQVMASAAPVRSLACRSRSG